jgi:hypothetical protein
MTWERTPNLFSREEALVQGKVRLAVSKSMYWNNTFSQMFSHLSTQAPSAMFYYPDSLDQSETSMLVSAGLATQPLVNN